MLSTVNPIRNYFREIFRLISASQHYVALRLLSFPPFHKQAALSQGVKSMTDYNSKATIQRKIAANLLKYIVKAAQSLPSLPSDHCVRVLENACSHGVNSVDFALAVCQAAVDRDPSSTVSFTFNDLPDNDFNVLLSVISGSAVADYKPTLHTLGKSMYTPLMKPGTLDLVYSCAALHWLSNVSWLQQTEFSLQQVAKQSQEDFTAYVSQRHKELRHGGKIVLSFPGVPEGEPGTNSCFRPVFERVHEIVAERGAASLTWMRQNCNCPTYSRNRAEVSAAFKDADWNVEVMELQEFEDLGAEDYRAGVVTLPELCERTVEMLMAVFRSTFMSLWVEYGGLKKSQAEDLMVAVRDALGQALREENALHV
ncbi:hypothetical protein BGZ94_008997, partial [Podila epigama]